MKRWRKKEERSIVGNKMGPNLTEVSFIEGRIKRRNSIDRFLPPPGEPRDCVLEV